MNHDHILLPFESAPQEPRVLANPSKEWLLAKWRERQATQFAAHAVEKVSLTIGGREFPLADAGLGGTALIARTPGGPGKLLGICSNEADAQARAAELATARCATGFHGWS